MEGRGGNYIARDITAPNSGELEFNHANMRLPQEARNQKLSSLPNGLHDRHKGVVVTIHADGSGGLIVPDRLNFEVCNFRMNEIQVTCSNCVCYFVLYLCFHTTFLIVTLV